MSAVTALTRNVTAERIKLASTRSPWWCAALAVVGVIGLVAVLVLTSGTAAPLRGGLALFLQFALIIVLVMAAVSVTSEYRFGTIRTTFQAAPRRTPVLLAKAVVVAVVGALVGLVTTWGSWLLGGALDPASGLTFSTSEDWRLLLFPGAVFALGAVLALGVGVLLRQTAGAVALLLVVPLLVENLVTVIPEIGDDVVAWMPFVNATAAMSVEGAVPLPWGPWTSLAYFAAVTAVVFAASLVVATRRDA